MRRIRWTFPLKFEGMVYFNFSEPEDEPEDGPNSRKMIFRLKSARNTARERIFVKNTQKRGEKEGGAQKKCPTAPFGPTSAPAAPLKIKSVTNVRAQHRARAFLWKILKKGWKRRGAPKKCIYVRIYVYLRTYYVRTTYSSTSGWSSHTSGPGTGSWSRAVQCSRGEPPSPSLPSATRCSACINSCAFFRLLFMGFRRLPLIFIVFWRFSCVFHTLRIVYVVFESIYYSMGFC